MISKGETHYKNTEKTQTNQEGAVLCYTLRKVSMCKNLVNFKTENKTLKTKCVTCEDVTEILSALVGNEQ